MAMAIKEMAKEVVRNSEGAIEDVPT